MSLPGGPELLIIAAVFVLLFGAKKLPELGSSIGKSIKNFKRGIEEARDEDDGTEADSTEADGKSDEKADEKPVNSSS
jgi:sec-independent protein translocase protein TatA